MSEGLDARLIASFCVAIVLDVLLPVAGVLWARRRQLTQPETRQPILFHLTLSPTWCRPGAASEEVR